MKLCDLRWFVAVVLIACGVSLGEPAPGDIFREYNMSATMYRVGERREWGGDNWGKNISFATSRGDDAVPHEVDLEHATRAEVVVGYDQCHSGTTGLSIAFNEREYLRLPVPQTIPPPRSGYMAWPFPEVQVPLEHLRAGRNQIKFRIDGEPRGKGQGGWHQNLVYSVVLRVYYDEAKPHPTGTLTGVTENGELGLSVPLGVDLSDNTRDLERVEYLGFYLDFDHDGDGIFREWQYRYQDFGPAGLYGHIGTAKSAPFDMTWDTTWLPDQPEPMHLAARLVAKDGVTFMTREVRRLRLVRPGHSVELCLPQNVPQGWVTRKGRMGQRFEVRGDLKNAVECRVMFRAWGGNDDKGGWVNDVAFDRFDGPHFVIPISSLRSGMNTLDSDKGGHHGMEIVWPGAVVFVRYATATPTTAPASQPAP